jgi:hypothetical protein
VGGRAGGWVGERARARGRVGGWMGGAVVGRTGGWVGGWVQGAPGPAILSARMLPPLQQLLARNLPESLTANLPLLLLPSAPADLLAAPFVEALRDLVPAVRGFVTRHRVGLSLFSTFNLALIVWQVLSGAQSIREWRRLPACPPARCCRNCAALSC